jgi:hypothetical protein
VIENSAKRTRGLATDQPQNFKYKPLFKLKFVGFKFKKLLDCQEEQAEIKEIWKIPQLVNLKINLSLFTLF